MLYSIEFENFFLMQIASMQVSVAQRVIIGCHLNGELPWHSSLSRTRQLYVEDEFTIIFRKVLKMCVDQGLVSGKR